MAQDRLGLYTTCAIPSILYYLLVHRRPTRPSAPIFYSVVLLELIVPVLHNGQGGKNFDRAVVGIVGCFSAITMLLAGGRGSSSPSLTNVGVLWQKSAEKKKNDGSRTIDTDPVAEIRKDGFRWFIQGIILVLLSFPTMAIFDGFLRVCNEPPKNDTSYSLASYYYYFSLFGIAMVMHVAILPAYQLLFTSLRLLIRSLRINDIDKDKIQLLSRSYISLRDQPPMFDRPWLARSVHELWSKRWHQMLRQAFKTFAFTPVKNLFKNDTVGRAAGTMAVFAYSGLIHEYIIVVIIGYTEYIHRPGVFARQTAFFLLQGVATIISGQRDCHLPAWLGRILTLTFMIITAPLFLEPFLRIGLHIDAEIPGYPKFLDPHIGIICPFGAKNI